MLCKCFLLLFKKEKKNKKKEYEGFQHNASNHMLHTMGSTIIPPKEDILP